MEEVVDPEAGKVGLCKIIPPPGSISLCESCHINCSGCIAQKMVHVMGVFRSVLLVDGDEMKSPRLATLHS